MTITLKYKPNGVIVQHSAVITGNDLIKCNNDIYSHKYEEEFKFQLLDLSEVMEFDVSDEDMSYLAEMDRNYSKDNRIFACVVAPTDHAVTKSTLWKILSSGDTFESKVVRNIDEAFQWFKLKGIHIKHH